MIESFVIYTTLMLSMMLFAKYSSHLSFKKKGTILRIDYFIPILLFTVVFGIRYDVGVDYLNYLSYYENARYGIVPNKEFLYLFITTTFSRNDIHFALYFALLTFIQIFFLYLTFKNEPKILFFIIFVLFTGRYFVDWMNLIRQSIAFCIFIFSTKYIKERRIFVFLLFVSFAFLFHKSAIILVPLYPLLKKGRDYFPNTSLQIIILLIAFGLGQSHYWLNIKDQLEKLFIIFDYEQYISNFADTTRELNTGYGVYVLLFIDIIVVLFKKKMEVSFSETRFTLFYNLYFVGAILSLFIQGNIILERPILFFSSMKLIVSSYLLSYLWTHKKANGNLNILIFSLIIMLYMALFIASIVNGENGKVLYHVF